MAWGLNAEGGSRGFYFETRSSHSELKNNILLVKVVRRPTDGFFFRAESYVNVASEIERFDAGGIGPRIIDYYGGRSLHEQSHDESFMAYYSIASSAKAFMFLTNRNLPSRRSGNSPCLRGCTIWCSIIRSS